MRYDRVIVSKSFWRLMNRGECGDFEDQWAMPHPVPQSRARYFLDEIRHRVRRIHEVIRRARAKTRMRSRVEDAEPSTWVENPKDRGRFSLLRRVGTGSVSTCYEASRTDKGSLLVLKIVDSDASASSRQQIRNEISHFKKLERHPNVVRFIESFEDARGRTCMALEHCAHGSLADYLEHGATLGPHRVANLSRQILKGLQHVHRQGLVHRDLKLGNVLLTSDFTAKISDFGLASPLEFVRGSEAKLCGTPNYLAPEVCQRRGFSFASDIWSFGVCLYTLCTGQVPFHVAAEGRNLAAEEVISQTMAKIVSGRFHLSEETGPPSARTALARILVMEPEMRPTMEEMLEFEFLSCTCNPATCRDNESCRTRPRHSFNDQPSLVTASTTALCDSLLTFEGGVQQLVWVKCWGQVTSNSLHYMLSNGRQGVLQRQGSEVRHLVSKKDDSYFSELLEMVQLLELDLSNFSSPSSPTSPTSPKLPSERHKDDLLVWHYCSDGTIGFLFESGSWQVNFVDHTKLLVYRNCVVTIANGRGTHDNMCNWLHAPSNKRYVRTVHEIVRLFAAITAFNA